MPIHHGPVAGLMSRVEYIRRVVNRSKRTDAAEPHGDTFGILPMAEIQRIWARLTAERSPMRSSILRTACISHTDFKLFLAGKSGTDKRKGSPGHLGSKSGIGRVRLRKLSRILVMLEAGRLALRDGEFVPVEPPPPSAVQPKREHIVRLGFDIETGRPTIRIGEPFPKEKALPRWFAGLPGIPGAK